MEFANKLIAAGSNRVINVCLVGSFVALSVRSMNQQTHLEALEAEREALLTSNKAMKKTMWGWKQKLYAEAESNSGSVPLAKLKDIYGEASVSSCGDSGMAAAKSVEPRLIV